jgi:hypothetical protein
LESVAPDHAGEDALLWATAKLDPDVPTSYLYAETHFPAGWWPRLAAEEDTACVACWVHGKPYPGTGGPGPPWYTGRTVRLHFDGSVTVDEIVAVYHPTPEFLAEFPNTGVGVSWPPFFDPNETWEYWE